MTRKFLPIAVWILVIAAAAVVISRTRFSADLSAFLPRQPTAAQQLLVDQLHDGVVSRLVLAGISGAAPDQLAGASRALSERLRRDGRFVRVDNGDASQTERESAFVFDHRYALSPAIDAQHFSAASLRAALEDALELLASPAGLAAKALVQADPTGEVLLVTDRMAGAGHPATHDGVWISADATEALLVLQTRAPGFDIDTQEATLVALRAAFDEVRRAAGNAGLTLALTGPAVFAVQSRAGIKGDAIRFSSLATAMVALLLSITFRSPRALALGMVPVVSGATVGIAAVSLRFGEVHGITLGFGATLIGEAVDYAIYLFMQTDARRGAGGTLERIWPTLRLGVMTSICGFSALLLSGFPGLSQLGLFSIAGLVTAALVTRFVLPSLLPSRFAITGVERPGAMVRRAFERARVLRPLIALAVVVALAVLFSRDRLWNDELSSLSPVRTSDQLLDQRLRGGLGAADVRHLVVARATGPDEALALAEKVGVALDRAQADGYLAGYESPAQVLPSGRTQLQRRDSLPDEATLRRNLDTASAGLPFRKGTFEPFIDAVRQARDAPLLDRAALAGTAFGIRLDALLAHHAGGWSAMLPLTGVTDPAGIARALAGLHDAHVILLDTKAESDALYGTYLRDALLLSLAGAGAIVILLGATLRTPRRVLAVCMPLAAAVLVATAALVALGQTLTIFHLVGMLLVVAVGSNYALFFDRALVDGIEARTALSLALANTTTVIGFGMLAFSDAPVLVAIGSTVGVGAFLSLVFAAALAPREAVRS